MHILIAGASGFIGKELVRALATDHRVSVLGRDMSHLNQCFDANIAKLTWENLPKQDAKQYDVVINLCGTNIGAKKWNQAIKDELIESRVATNRQLIAWLIAAEAKPRYFCANAIGIYGAHDESSISFDENTALNIAAKPSDFLQTISFAWQESLQPAIDCGLSVTTLRFGVVLKKGEGMLKKLELPFALGLGAIFGSGKQVVSWIHHADLVAAVKFLLEHPDVTDAVNLTSPQPVTQKEFAIAFARALHRPQFLKMPAWFVKAGFGEMGDLLILKGQRVIPQRLLQLNFSFRYASIEAALHAEYS